jgi:hypothetical protein
VLDRFVRTGTAVQFPRALDMVEVYQSFETLQVRGDIG